MSDVKFSELTIASSITGSDFIPIVRSGSASGSSPGAAPNNYIVQAQYFTASYAAQAESSSYALTASYLKFDNLLVTGDGQIQGHLTVNQGITADLDGTSSWASSSLTSSYLQPYYTYDVTASLSTTSSYSETSALATSASYSSTSSYALNASGSNIYAISSSYARSASYSNFAETSSYLKNVYVDTVPVGTISAFGLSSAPANWLVCDGSEVSQSLTQLYAAIGTLFNNGSEAIGNFRLPDLRGRFVRGLDNGVGNDPSAPRDVGSYQSDAFQGHSHVLQAGVSAGAAGVTRATNSGTTVPITNAIGGAITDGINGTPITSSETRPKNVALIYCIKYSTAANLTDLTGTNLSGDVQGNVSASTVVAIRGKSISATTPSNKDVLEYNGVVWTPSSKLNDVSSSLYQLSASISAGVLSTVTIMSTFNGATVGSTRTAAHGRSSIPKMYKVVLRCINASGNSDHGYSLNDEVDISGITTAYDGVTVPPFAITVDSTDIRCTWANASAPRFLHKTNGQYKSVMNYPSNWAMIAYIYA